jgi:hypothetical protein
MSTTTGLVFFEEEGTLMTIFRRSSAPADGFTEAMWETLIAVAMAVAICISLISLSAHLNEVKTVREAGMHAAPPAAEHRLPAAGAASQFD